MEARECLWLIFFKHRGTERQRDRGRLIEAQRDPIDIGLVLRVGGVEWNAV